MENSRFHHMGLSFRRVFGKSTPKQSAWTQVLGQHLRPAHLKTLSENQSVDAGNWCCVVILLVNKSLPKLSHSPLYVMNSPEDHLGCIALSCYSSAELISQKCH